MIIFREYGLFPIFMDDVMGFFKCSENTSDEGPYKGRKWLPYKRLTVLRMTAYWLQIYIYWSGHKEDVSLKSFHHIETSRYVEQMPVRPTGVLATQCRRAKRELCVHTSTTGHGFDTCMWPEAAASFPWGKPTIDGINFKEMRCDLKFSLPRLCWCYRITHC
jgi:hypothetical protein